jgi:DMSO reductase anchor subunit
MRMSGESSGMRMHFILHPLQKWHRGYQPFFFILFFLINGIVAIKLALANGLKNNEFMFTGYPVVGFQNRMQTSGSCRFNIVVIPLCFLITSCYRFMDSGVKGIINACFFMQIEQNLT